jgi:hypothetical protein
MILIFQASLFRFVTILQGDEYSFERPQKSETHNKREGKKNHEMDPKRRLIAQFRPERRAEHEKTADESDEDRRTVAGIGKAKIEAAGVAAWRESEKSRKDLALSASRAGSLDPAEKR